MANKHVLTEADILPAAEYARTRPDWRRKISAIKKERRVEVGPYVSNSRHEGPACLEPAPPGGGRADPPQLSLGI